MTTIKVPTIRYYEDIGLVLPACRSAGNQRLYSDVELKRLSFIKHARHLGFSLESIRSLLTLNDTPQASCQEVDKLASAHLAQVREKLNLLQQLEQELARMVSGCKKGEVNDCYVIQSLLNHDLCLHEH